MDSIAYDLHIHSCLSPCADNDMTPANIIGMAMLKELDAIAITDHNSCRNCDVAMQMGEVYGITVIPGMELTTREEVHVLCLFERLSDALAFDSYVYQKLIKIPNDKKIFGSQRIVDAEEHILSEEQYLLIQATEISFDEVYELTNSYHGVMIPAHIDKNSFSLISNLGFVPENSKFRCIELKSMDEEKKLKEQHPYLKHCKVISNSDAHTLWQMNERVHFLHADSRETRDILKSLIALTE